LSGVNLSGGNFSGTTPGFQALRNLRLPATEPAITPLQRLNPKSILAGTAALIAP